MVKFMENASVVAVADYTAAGTPLNWQPIVKERDIESLDVIFCMGAVTKANTTDWLMEPAWGLTFFQVAYDDKTIRLPGRHLAAYNSFFYPDDPAIVGSSAYTSVLAVGMAANEWYGRYRIAVHIPALNGAYVSCTAVTTGEIPWVGVAANNAIAASNIFIIPRYGTFDYAISANYLTQAAVAADTQFIPGVTGKLYIGSIIGAYTSLTALSIAGVALSDNYYGVNTYATDNVTSLLVDVGGESIIQLPNAVQCEWPFCRGVLMRKLNHAVANATPVSIGGVIPLCELIIEGGVAFGSSASLRYFINANTADLLVTSIFGDALNSKPTEVALVGNTQPGPGGTATAPPQRQPQTGRGAPSRPMTSVGRQR